MGGLVLSGAGAGDLSGPARSEVIALCADAYGEDFAGLFESLPGSAHVLARLGARLVGHAAWVTRWLQPGDGGLLRTAYVEAVATAPDCRHRGIASAVLRELAARVADYDLAALSPSEPGFYARLGWESWRGPLSVRGVGGEAVPTPDEEVMILRLPRTPGLDLDGPLSGEWRRGELW